MLYQKGMSIIMFQLFGFYYMPWKYDGDPCDESSRCPTLSRQGAVGLLLPPHLQPSSVAVHSKLAQCPREKIDTWVPMNPTPSVQLCRPKLRAVRCPPEDREPF